MFFNRGCNRGKSKLVIQDYEREFLPDGQSVLKRVRNTINIIGSNDSSAPISGDSVTSEIEELVEDDDNDHYHNVFGEPGPSHYKQSRLKAVSHWREIRANLVKVSLKREGFLGGNQCQRCKTNHDQTARFRCQDCGGLLLCETCCISIHTTENILHCPETWKVS